jgi:hypothetical protein
LLHQGSGQPDGPVEADQIAQDGRLRDGPGQLAQADRRHGEGPPSRRLRERQGHQHDPRGDAEGLEQPQEPGIEHIAEPAEPVVGMDEPAVPLDRRRMGMAPQDGAALEQRDVVARVEQPGSRHARPTGADDCDFHDRPFHEKNGTSAAPPIDGRHTPTSRKT